MVNSKEVLTGTVALNDRVITQVIPKGSLCISRPQPYCFQTSVAIVFSWILNSYREDNIKDCLNMCAILPGITLQKVKYVQILQKVTFFLKQSLFQGVASFQVKEQMIQSLLGLSLFLTLFFINTNRCHGVFPRPAHQHFLGTCWKCDFLGPHTGPTESKTLGVMPSNLCLTSSPGDSGSC